jgi:hypothetical protein
VPCGVIDERLAGHKQHASARADHDMYVCTVRARSAASGEESGRSVRRRRQVGVEIEFSYIYLNLFEKLTQADDVSMRTNGWVNSREPLSAWRLPARDDVLRVHRRSRFESAPGAPGIGSSKYSKSRRRRGSRQ